MAKRGRPALFTGAILAGIVSLLRVHGATGTQNVLASRNGKVGVSKEEQALAEIRRKAGFEKPLSISMPTLLKFAKKAKIKLQVGRPAVAA